ncbi:MAG: hypothetical protein M3277_11670 [Actinomycetota bacterium]|nr:hypothetical protein [Actinomycetota bacterium]
MQCTSPDACTLDRTKLAERIADWREVSSQAISRRVETDRITSTYPSDPQLLKRLRDLIAAEEECCAFLHFTIQEGERQTVVELAFPPDARPLIEAVVSISPALQ